MINSLKLYRFEPIYKGEIINLHPQVPKRIMAGEDNVTKRICVCPTITGCIRSLGWPTSLYSSFDTNQGIPIYLYSAIIPIEMIFEPNIDEVPDVLVTGELWIKTDASFILEDKYILRKVKKLTNILCEYTLIKESAKNEYGNILSFNFIEYDRY